MVTLASIRAAVRATFGVTDAQLDGRDRHQSIALARHVAMYLVRRHTPLSYPEIGRAFGDRDHATAMHAHARVTAQKDAAKWSAMLLDAERRASCVSTM